MGGWGKGPGVDSFSRLGTRAGGAAGKLAIAEKRNDRLYRLPKNRTSERTIAEKMNARTKNCQKNLFTEYSEITLYGCTKLTVRFDMRGGKLFTDGPGGAPAPPDPPHCFRLRRYGRRMFRPNFFVGRSGGDGAVLIISKNLRRQIF